MKRVDWFILVFIAALAAWVRLDRLEFMEFKQDEAVALVLARSVRTGGAIYLPATGLLSSVGVFNPPLFIYLLGVPSLVSGSPVFVAGTIALVNAFAAIVCYVGGLRLFDRRTAVVAGLLLATCPSAILFSRKIWAQDVVPVFGLGAALALVSFLRRPGFWNQFFLVATIGLGWQVHFSGLGLFPVAAAALVYRFRALRFAPIALGVGLSFVPLLPYLRFQKDTRLSSLGIRSPATVAAAGRRESLPSRFGRALSAPGRLLSGAVLSSEYGFRPSGSAKVAGGFLRTLEVCLPLALLWLLAVRSPVEGAFLAAFVVMPLLLLPPTRIGIQASYYVILLPAACLAVGRVCSLVVEGRVCGERPSPGTDPAPRAAPAHAVFAFRTLLALVVLANIVFWEGFLAEIVRIGGIEGEYGTAYLWKLRTAEYILREFPAVEQFKMVCPPRNQLSVDFAYLIVLRGPAVRSRPGPPGTCTIWDTLSRERCSAPPLRPTKEVGPVRIYFTAEPGKPPER